LSSITNVTLLKTKGQVLLSLPQIPQPQYYYEYEEEEGVTDPLSSPTLPDIKSISKEFIHAIESSVIEWVYQIKNLEDLRISPKFTSGKNPGPRSEIHFWQKKEQNFEAIMEQLECIPLGRIGIIVEGNKKSYFNC
jgi:hypothetical protein